MTVQSKNEEMRSIIHRTKIDEKWSGRLPALLSVLTKQIADNAPSILDIGKSSRENWEMFAPGQAKSADINQFDGYPDIIMDVCDIDTYPDEMYDAIICHSILEHVYDPKAAVDNMAKHIRADGFFLGFTPFLMNYHAPKDLKFQDFYRFTRDGLAYLFRDFRDVTLYPVRGRAATLASLVWPLKKLARRSDGSEPLSRAMDKLLPGNPLQTTGYVIFAKK
ncbi:class I SAM-dependent methyltransferase [Devosia sp. XJ19-1]|uniref:Class I SAM-dependent methyltransferase n=1 Tax=Devosia ureilytica TaxID=2952754 RepID=A0A9Q4AKK7_9HYPH|nr:methyltransferase domain-containing protein [Devosia ureilytica]MCP8882619.1 class I SAM-dependent methyltransferase [Devosia ureilytica]MCP8885494.1 class I SAM-dependent methyltransferase [Devosia ureilytica]